MIQRVLFRFHNICQRTDNIWYFCVTIKCLECDYLFICNGGCPKNRIIDTGDKFKLNYLCNGYKLFFAYIDPFMNKLGSSLFSVGNTNVIY